MPSLGAIRSSVAALFTVLLATVPARAESSGCNTPIGGAGLPQLAWLFAVWPLGALPSEAGPEISAFGPAPSAPHVVIGIPLQYNLVCENTVHHRVVATPELLVGSQPADPPTHDVLFTFRGRLGYRAVWHPPAAQTGFLAGLGSSLELWPVARPSLSPEIGLHVGDYLLTTNGTFAWTLVLRADVFGAGDDRLRMSLLLGWALH